MRTMLNYATRNEQTHDAVHVKVARVSALLSWLYLFKQGLYAWALLGCAIMKCVNVQVTRNVLKVASNDTDVEPAPVTNCTRTWYTTNKRTAQKILLFQMHRTGWVRGDGRTVVQLLFQVGFMEFLYETFQTDSWLYCSRSRRPGRYDFRFSPVTRSPGRFRTRDN